MSCMPLLATTFSPSNIFSSRLSPANISSTAIYILAQASCKSDGLSVNGTFFSLSGWGFSLSFTKSNTSLTLLQQSSLVFLQLQTFMVQQNSGRFLNLITIVSGPMITICRLLMKGDWDLPQMDLMQDFQSQRTVVQQSQSGSRQVLMTYAHLQGQLDLKVSIWEYSVNRRYLMKDLPTCSSYQGLFYNSGIDRLQPLQTSIFCDFYENLLNSYEFKLKLRQCSFFLNNPMASFPDDLGNETPLNLMLWSNPANSLEISPSTTSFICALTLINSKPKCFLQYSSTSSILSSFLPFHKSFSWVLSELILPSTSWLMVWKLEMMVQRYSAFLFYSGFLMVLSISVHMESYLLQERLRCQEYLEWSIQLIIDQRKRGIFWSIQSRMISVIWQFSCSDLILAVSKVSPFVDMFCRQQMFFSYKARLMTRWASFWQLPHREDWHWRQCSSLNQHLEQNTLLSFMQQYSNSFSWERSHISNFCRTISSRTLTKFTNLFYPLIFQSFNQSTYLLIYFNQFLRLYVFLFLLA